MPSVLGAERTADEPALVVDVDLGQVAGVIDRLDLLAFEAYGDATQWRLLAAANQITDPLHLRPGQVLLLPPLTEETRHAR